MRSCCEARAVTQGSAPMPNLYVSADNQITNTGYTHDAAGNAPSNGEYYIARDRPLAGS